MTYRYRTMAGIEDIDARVRALPDELVSKIMWYALKCPYDDLEPGFLKRLLTPPTYTTMIGMGAIVVHNGHVTKISPYKPGYEEMAGLDFFSDEDDLVDTYDINFDIQALTSLQSLIRLDLSHTCVSGDIKHLGSLPNLTAFNLGDTGVFHPKEDVSGDIKHLTSMPSLTEFHLDNTGVSGDIKHLNSMPNLTTFSLSNTGVSGDIKDLNSMQNLTKFDLSATGVSGDIKDLNAKPSLTSISLWFTGVSGDVRAFTDYRESEGLPACSVRLEGGISTPF